MPNTQSGYRYPTGDGDSSIWLHIQALAEDIENNAKATVANQAARLAIPSPQPGLLVSERDTRTIYQCTATGWELVWQPRISYASRSLLIVERTGFNVSPGSSWSQVTGWTTERSSAAFSVSTSTGVITCNRDGWLALNGYVYSDRAPARQVGVRYRVPGGSSASATEHVYDHRHSPGGGAYPLAGLLRQPVSWSGRVQAGETTYIGITQSNSSDQTDPFNIYLTLEYQNDF